MRERPGLGWARGIGLLAGLAMATVAVLAWRVPAGGGTLGTDLIIAAVPTGEIDVSTPGPFLSAIAMRPGPEADAPSGRVRVRNETGQPLAIGMRALTSISDLDSLLWVEIDAGGSRLFRGTVGAMRKGTRETFTLASGERTTIAVHAWLPPAVTSGYEGRVANVDLTFLPTPVGA